MSIHLGHKQADGVVRYISLCYDTSNFTYLLKNFYSKESRVVALIDLGNISRLGPSPYGKYSTKGYDKINCVAEIRDCKEKKGKHLPRYADSEEAYIKLDKHLFLYKDGCWHLYAKGKFTKYLHDRLRTPMTDVFKDIGFYAISEAGNLEEIPSWKVEYKSWQDLEQCTTPTFLIKDKRLIKTINHPLNQ